MNLNEAYAVALKQKMALMKTIREQMTDDVENGVIKPKTINAFNMAQASFDAAIIHQSKPEDSLHHYSRGCVNYGDFMARQKIDRSK